jgi:hypothetical protein
LSNRPNKIELWGFDGLEKHKKICRMHKLCNPIMLDEKDDRFIEFKNFTKSDRIPIIIIADFECFLKKSTVYY